jgi:glycosyltransferase involved in cell wall biosynthesis
LREAIESCLNQTFPDWELIIVDDASTDETPAIIAQYLERDERVRSITNAANRKLPASLNIGFEAARGDLLTWTSDDNLYRPGALDEMVAFLRRSPHIDLVYADFTVIDEHGLPTKPGWTGPLSELPLADVIGACFLYRRKVHERLGGYAEDLYLVEDYDFWMRASKLFKFGWLQRDLYLYRSHPHSLTSTRTQDIQIAGDRCLARNLPAMDWVCSDVRTAAYRGMICRAMQRHERQTAWRYFVSWLRSDPFVLVREAQALIYLLLPVRFYEWIKDESPWEWMQKLLLWEQEIKRVVPRGAKFIQVDEGKLGNHMLPDRVAIPFTEQDGQYWGPPSDDIAAVQEFERLRRCGASFIAFAWPAFWYLQYYSALQKHLRSRFRCVLENDRLIVFDIREPAAVEL